MCSIHHLYEAVFVIILGLGIKFKCEPLKFCKQFNNFIIIYSVTFIWMDVSLFLKQIKIRIEYEYIRVFLSLSLEAFAYKMSVHYSFSEVIINAHMG